MATKNSQSIDNKKGAGYPRAFLLFNSIQRV